MRIVRTGHRHAPVSHRNAARNRPALTTLAVGLFFLGLMALAACDPTSFVTIETTDDAQQVVDANPPGTAFRFAPGVHNGVHIIPKSGNTFSADALGDVVLNGNGAELPAFVSRTNRMTSDWRRNVVIENLVFTNYSPQDLSLIHI